LLVLAVVPQLASLAGMAGMLWVVRIKDVFSAPVTFAEDSSTAGVMFNLSPGDRAKLDLGSVIHGAVVARAGHPGIEFTATVTAVEHRAETAGHSTWHIECRLEAPAGQDGDVPAELIDQRQEVVAQMWTRTRRALFVILGSRSPAGGDTGGPQGLLSVGGG
jgi:hypothetical protein